MKILLDMNFSPRWVSWLADKKIDAVHMAVRQFSTELAAGCLITLSENCQRIRLLNLKEQ